MPAKLLFPVLVGVSGHPFVFVVLASATDDRAQYAPRALCATHNLPVSTTRNASYPRRLKVLQTTPTSPPNTTLRSLPSPKDGAARFCPSLD
ncbi:hypothetical protein DFH11DRAFT_1589049 [Phellopilus nigrolimitatus]|nr:hypothetical protein DFH11DRAFT_1589049 [Phellopilus nigrolimitatus]